jgi:hypothetical protein
MRKGIVQEAQPLHAPNIARAEGLSSTRPGWNLRCATPAVRGGGSAGSVVSCGTRAGGQRRSPTGSSPTGTPTCGYALAYWRASDEGTRSSKAQQGARRAAGVEERGADKTRAPSSGLGFGKDVV